jgi:hypothetical protein
MTWACELDLTGLGQGLTDSPCEHAIIWGSITDGKFLIIEMPLNFF